jgi:hypothetical protein
LAFHDAIHDLPDDMRRIRSSGEWFRAAGFQHATGKISQGSIPRKPGSTVKFPSAHTIRLAQSSARLSEKLRENSNPRAMKFSQIPVQKHCVSEPDSRGTNH